MKRTILSMLLLGSTCAVFAQTTGTTQSAPPDRRAMDTMFSATGDDQAELTTTNTSTGTYSAYGTYTSVNTAPLYIQQSFMQTYPTAADVAWYQATDWYRASYMMNGRSMNVYYGPNGSNYAVALPVIQSYVPEEVISKAIGMHGQNLYSITSVRTAEGQEAYHITLIENGQTRSEWVGTDGSTIANAYRTDDANAAWGAPNNSQWNNNQMNSNSTQMNNNNMGSLDNGTTSGTTGSTLNTTGTTGTTSGSTMNSTNNTSTDKKKTKPGKY